MKKSQIHIPISKNITLQGRLSIPNGAKSLVIFSDGSARSRFSTRNRLVSDVFNKEKAATLLTDLLTEHEDSFYKNHFDIDMLSARLAKITSYVTRIPGLKDLPIGFFGTNTGAASALQAATKLKNKVYAVVSRSGRPDLANNLDQVQIPALFIVAGMDLEVKKMNEKADAMMYCDKKIAVVDGASYLFNEPGKLNEVAALASDWFNKHLVNRNLGNEYLKKVA